MAWSLVGDVWNTNGFTAYTAGALGDDNLNGQDGWVDASTYPGHTYSGSIINATVGGRTSKFAGFKYHEGCSRNTTSSNSFKDNYYHEIDFDFNELIYTTNHYGAIYTSISRYSGGNRYYNRLRIQFGYNGTSRYLQFDVQSSGWSTQYTYTMTGSQNGKWRSLNLKIYYSSNTVTIEPYYESDVTGSLISIGPPIVLTEESSIDPTVADPYIGFSVEVENYGASERFYIDDLSIVEYVQIAPPDPSNVILAGGVHTPDRTEDSLDTDSISIKTGDTTGTGSNSGSISITTGDSANDNSGDINLTTGNGPGYGSIIASSAQLIYNDSTSSPDKSIMVLSAYESAFYIDAGNKFNVYNRDEESIFSVSPYQAVPFNILEMSANATNTGVAMMMKPYENTNNAFILFYDDVDRPINEAMGAIGFWGQGVTDGISMYGDYGSINIYTIAKENTDPSTDIIIQTGSTQNAVSGKLEINTGASSNDNSGDIIIRTGNGVGRGSVTIDSPAIYMPGQAGVTNIYVSSAVSFLDTVTSPDVKFAELTNQSFKLYDTADNSEFFVASIVDNSASIQLSGTAANPSAVMVMSAVNTSPDSESIIYFTNGPNIPGDLVGYVGFRESTFTCSGTGNITIAAGGIADQGINLNCDGGYINFQSDSTTNAYIIPAPNSDPTNVTFATVDETTSKNLILKTGDGTTTGDITIQTGSGGTRGSITIDAPIVTVAYTPANANDWGSPPPNDMAGALDILALSAGIDTYVLTYTINNNGVEITDGTKYPALYVPYDCEIEDVTVLADQSGDISIDIWKSDYANYPPDVTDSIITGGSPTPSPPDYVSISGGIKGINNTLNGWNTALSAGDCILFDVVSCTTITAVNVIIKVRRV